MKGLNSGRPYTSYTVRTTEQAKLLTHTTSKTFFKPFIARERTASQAAAELGCSLNTLLYRVKTFLKAGLLYVVRKEKRAGRPVKVYRSVGDEVFIPFRLTPHADLEELLRVQIEPFSNDLIRRLARAYQQNGSNGQRLHRDESGTVWTNTTDEVRRFVLENFQAPVVLYSDITINLAHNEVKALQRTLNDLFIQTLESVSNQQGEPYTLQIALIPYES